MAEVLNPLTLPLQGSQLIEASAGTGKTWTIAALVVRLVLGHGAPGQGLGRPLLPGEILVMTFTRAATRELSDRIRRRLVEAAAWFRVETGGETGGVPGGEPGAVADDFITGLLQNYPPGPQRQQAAWRLALAAESMDDAAVHTIDAWCQRMLREHAFDSGCLFDEELLPSEAALLAQAVRDYWRQQVYPLDAHALDGVLAHWPDPDALLTDVQVLLGKPLPVDAGQGTLADCMDRAAQRRADVLADLKAGWSLRADAMLDWLQPIWHDKAHPARKGLPGEAHATRWIQTLKDWASDPAADHLDVKKGAERLTRAAVVAAFPPGGMVHIPACFAEFERLMPDLKSLPESGPAVRLHAAARVAERMQQMKRQAGTFGFSDMLERLDAALDVAVQGAKAERLRQRIVAQYPAALIDEFQDTSPVQLRIFDRLYRIADNDPSRVLLLIGDPKQAIYAFRGADIYSYLGARLATQGRHHVLGTNHRSTTQLVAAVNSLFQAAEDRPGGGAFMFRDAVAPGAAGVAESALPFVPVQAKGRPERFVTAAGNEPAVTAVVDAALRNAAGSRALFAALCAERIVTLLNDPQAGFAEPGGRFTHLRPADMAVLVRSGTEADAVRQALRQRGLASVYLSDKDTVYQTDEAADLLRLLQAVAAPRNARLARAAFATALLGLTLDELLTLATDDERFDQRCALLQPLNAAWKSQGVLAMVRRALHAFDMPARLLALPAGSGERRLTNVLHLAELLQAASAQTDGEQALMRWLAQQIDDGAAGLATGDELVLRLESDADVVKVVTVHKSKGLEYPLVFLPFLAHFRDVDSDKNAVLVLPGLPGPPGLSGGAATQQLVLQPTKDQVAVADQERLREHLRLLYVALTRSRHALWLGLAGLQVGQRKAYTWHRSAIGCLLSGPQPQPPEQRMLDIAELAAHCPQVVVQQAQGALPAVLLTPLQPRETLPALVTPPAYTAQFDRNWAISSYSALVRTAPRNADGAGRVAPPAMLDDEPALIGTAIDTMRDSVTVSVTDTAAAPAPAAAARERPADQPWHRFPRGAFAGNFLHDLLEWLANEGFALDTSPALQQALVQRCHRQGWGNRADDVLAWLRQVCATVLPALGVPLAALGTVTPEMEFWLPSDGLRSSQIDSLCVQHLQPSRPRPPLPERALQGMLMGFADLVFEHGGRYWVLDYKSNALGPRDADYSQETMQAAMLEHRYDVQAALYLLALHRLLKSRLGAAYDPAQHLGGAIYLFLRGMRSASAGCCHVAPPLALLDGLEAMLLAGRAGSPGTAA